ncbi:Type III secretion inner membrane protein (YscD,flagellar export component) [Candidatus Burkholderia pumila]|uniref:Type III secretion inner membrane protein (YscD,flagellar export component) n=1 Tax=Candidatus Burkholderia pumila TaxID=1090375 RepID=A0ABR5HNJ0_9BURK|nr:Type III secretion inner membrane protein (YscD,flagellar export component) [Candidatus Burkholderia pumila]
MPDAAWPSDLALLSTLLNGPPEVGEGAGAGAGEDDAAEGATHLKKRHRYAYAGIAVACTVVGVAAVGISFALTANVSRAAIAPPDVQMEQKLDRALAQAHLNELHIAPDGAAGEDGAPRVIACGMVRTANDDYVARQLFERMKPDIVERRYGVADDTTRGIRDAIGIDGVEVKYYGQGVFTLPGTVADKQRVEQALERVKGDFGKRIREIRIALTDVAQSVPAPKKGTYIALVSSGDVQYAQTPDGVKHIYTAAQDEAASDAEPELPH